MNVFDDFYEKGIVNSIGFVFIYLFLRWIRDRIISFNWKHSRVDNQVNDIVN